MRSSATTTDDAARWQRRQMARLRANAVEFRAALDA
jgi:hypothetical protein